MPNINIERLAQPKIRITEVSLSPWPDPPQSLMSFPGFKDWWKQMLLCRERDKEAFNRLLLNRESS